MAKVLTILFFVPLLFGCRMSKSDMKKSFDDSIIKGLRCVIQNKIDSAFYYKGQADAFFEAVYNEKIKK